LRVDAGDFSMGTLFHTSFPKEASELRLVGKMSYDVATFGNHDFDFHAEGLAKMLQAARSKSQQLPALVASNIIFSRNDPGDAALKQAFKDYPVKNKSEDQELARKVPQIDVIISGHTHTILPKPIKVGRTIIVSSGCCGEYLGILKVFYTKGKDIKVASYVLRNIAAGIPDDRIISEEVAGYPLLAFYVNGKEL
jgi:2',3'-cyclic-nucleotide 2'-phosphodiesterase (5'-nucleotidase family)